MFKREEKPEDVKPPDLCARCRAEALWSIWGHRVCLGCRDAWDALALNENFQAATDEWIRKGKAA